MLLYKYGELTREFEARIPEKIDNLKLSSISLQFIDEYQVRIIYFKVDISTHNLGVYKIKRGSENEYNEILLNRTN